MLARLPALFGRRVSGCVLNRVAFFSSLPRQISGLTSFRSSLFAKRSFSSKASGKSTPDEPGMGAHPAPSSSLGTPWSGREVSITFPVPRVLEEVTADVAKEPTPTYPLRPSYAEFQNNLRPHSQVVVFDGAPDDPHRPSSTPIYQTSTFRPVSATTFGPYDYTRSGNPTRTALEKHVAMLERASIAFSFTTGMAALGTVTRLANGSEGEEIICCDDVYGGMYRLLTQVATVQGVKHRFVNTTDPENVLRSLSAKTRIVHVESPSNPLMRVSDLRRLSELLRPHGVLLSVDASAMSPLLMRPLDLGADIVVHSATKHFSGHADCMGGLICVRDENLAKRIGFLQNAEGTAIAPIEAWLMQRGIKTMALRIERAQENARRMVEFLAEHPRVVRIYWPGPEAGAKSGLSHGELDVHALQASGPGTLVSFETGSVRVSRRFMDACRIFKITVSFGSVNSLCEMPCDMSHGSMPTDKCHLPPDLVRLSIGIEDHHDLRQDLAQAFDLAANLQIPDELLSGKNYDSKFEDLPLVG